jgi:hypothetical protein
VLAIEDKSDGALVGFVYLNNIDWFAPPEVDVFHRKKAADSLIASRSR